MKLTPASILALQLVSYSFSLPAGRVESQGDVWNIEKRAAGYKQDASDIKRPYWAPVFPDAPIGSYVCNSNSLFQRGGTGDWVVLDSCRGEEVCKVSIPHYVGCARPRQKTNVFFSVNNETLME
ncbi:hypothetical protein BDR26DRAFT_868133 [Obelidium mucronatum]|nr:hypothetical protein BDR26DRAFT_868133 [Obelidium mucronatum]